MAVDIKRSPARISVIKKSRDGGRVEVTVPKDMTGRDVASVNDVLINKVIKGLTGCACLSGVIEVLWKPEFEDIIRVDLPSQV